MDADRARIAGIVESARRLPEAARRAYLDGLRLAEADRREVEGALRAGLTFVGAAPSLAPTVAEPGLPGEAPAAISRVDGARLLDPLVGRTFAGVAIERIVGSGGMGRVYLGTDAATGGRVALKVLLRTQHDEAVRRRFEREGRLLERLRHPGIAAVLRTGLEPDGDLEVPYIVMEYVDGVQHIADHVFRERLGMRETVEEFLQACDAIGHAHREGYIHRDIKPQNVLVDRHGRVKVIDFGVARAIASDPAVNTIRTETGQLVGTMQYMSPEQFMADPRLVDARTDVYALGAVLYELLTGVQPHDLRGLPVHEASRTVCETDPADVRQCNPRVEDGLASIVMDAVSRDPSRRPDDANALAMRLRGWLARGAVVEAGDRAPRAPGAPAAPAEGRQAARGTSAAPAPPGRSGGWGIALLLVPLLAGALAIAFGAVDVRALVARTREFLGGTAPATAEPAAAASERARIVVAPRDARIEVDGEPAGTGSAEIAPRADGSPRSVVARLDGWGEARTSWSGRRDGGLLALNLVPPEGIALLPRVVTLVVGPMPKGGSVSLVSPEARALGEGTWAVEVVFGRDASGWRAEEIALEARRADGTPATVRAGQGSGTGSLKVRVAPEDAGRPIAVQVR